MKWDDDLATVWMTPLLVASLLPYHRDRAHARPGRLVRIADREAAAHGRATSNTFAPAGIANDEGSNQRSSASRAFCTASSSVSPAEAQPGNSGKKAAHRSVSASRSTTSRSFIPSSIERTSNIFNSRVDGAIGAEYLKALRQLLENPSLLLL